MAALRSGKLSSYRLAWNKRQPLVKLLRSPATGGTNKTLSGPIFKINQAQNDAQWPSAARKPLGGLQIVSSEDTKSEIWWKCSFCDFKTLNSKGSWATKDGARRYHLTHIHHTSAKRSPEESGGLCHGGRGALCLRSCAALLSSYCCTVPLRSTSL